MNYRALDEALAYLNDEPIEDGMLYESLEDEFNFDILLILAEQEMFESFSELVTESEEIVALNEGVRETIMKYVQNIVAGIQKAWDKFVQAFTQKELEHLQKQVKPLIDKNPDLSFTINNYKTYDFAKMKDVGVVPFDYERMQNNLDSVNDFIGFAYAGKLDMQNSKNLKEAMEKFLNKKIEEKYPVDQAKLLEIYKFAAVDYFEYRKQIQQDIENLNNSNETIKNMVNQVLAAENPVNASYEFELDSQIMISEAEGDDKEGKMSFTDNSGETTGTDKEGKENNEKRKAITKSVTTYMSASTKILSAKMSILNKAKRESIIILNHFYASKKVNDTAVAAKNKVENIRTDMAAKVNTTIGRKK